MTYNFVYLDSNNKLTNLNAFDFNLNTITVNNNSVLNGPLQVNNNVNMNSVTLTGSLTTNSSAGQQGQILSSTGSGLSWINNYTLPTANETTLGGVKIGSGLNISNGVLSSSSGGGSSLWTSGSNSSAYFLNNIGIGTTNASSRLTVNGGHIDLSNGGIYIYTDTEAQAAYADIVIKRKFDLVDPNDYYQHNKKLGSIAFKGKDVRSNGSTGMDNVEVAQIYGCHSYGSTFYGGALKFATQTPGNGPYGPSTDRMIINHDGNVGINTMSPSEKLEVQGVIRAFNDTIANHNSAELILRRKTNGMDSKNASIKFEGSDSQGTVWEQAQIYAEDKGDSAQNKWYGGCLKFCTKKLFSNVTDSNNDTNGPTVRMTIDHNGNVGIGTTSPSEKLHVDGTAKANRFIADLQSTQNYGFSMTMEDLASNYNYAGIAWYDTLANAVTGGGQGRKALIEAKKDNGDLFFLTNGNCCFSYSTTYVGIGTSTPGYPLEVVGTASDSSPGTVYYRYITDYNNNTMQYGSASAVSSVSAKFNGRIWITDVIYNSSDSRIKSNIVDVPDNLALQQLRNIPCRYYEYIDKLERGTSKTIGFIAQEVKDIFPMAVTQKKQIIPNIYKTINSTWTTDYDKFIMSSTDLTNINGVKYKFYVSNASDGSDEKCVEVTGNSDNTFTFDSQYDNVFCYGSEVDDFNILDKQKLFTLNFSATQELDRIQQTHIKKIETLETENATLKAENIQQQTEINTLKSIIDKLTSATSFDDFKSKL